jgi:polysaccharide biosynthesis protein PelD
MENILLQYNEKSRFLGLRRSALIEMIAFFAITMALAYFFADSPRFINAWVHPFFIIVILMSAQYGSNEGLVCAILSSIVLLLGNLPERHINQDAYAWLFEVAKLPICWLIIAVVLGELRQRHIRERQELIEQLRASSEREKTFSKHYEQVKERKERLELSIAGRVKTEIGALRAAKSIEKLDPDHVLEGVMKMVRSSLGAEKFSIYLMEDNQLRLHSNYGWSETDEQNMATVYRFDEPLFQSIVVRRELLTIRNVDGEKLLAKQGLIASPLYDTESGQIIGMLKIEAISFLEFNIETVEIIKAICEWIALAISNARYYQTAVDETVVNPEHNLMTRSFFNRYKDYITALARRLRFNVFMLNVTVLNYETMPADEQIKIARGLAEVVDGTLRNVDFAFDHQQTNGSYGIILPATDVNGAQIVRDKIEKQLQKVAAQNMRGARFNFSLTALHEVA